MIKKSALFLTKWRSLCTGIWLLTVASIAMAQENGTGRENQTERNPFEKRFHWGLSYNNYWTTITGDQLTQPYFSKPSIGFNLRAEYYLLNFLGLGIGAGFQQRGTGIINVDVDNSPGNPDSTYLERLRFNTIEFPLGLVVRTPMDIIKGIRLSGSISIVPMINFASTKVFLNTADGGHHYTDVSATYYTTDVANQFTLGADITCGTTQLLQVHAVYTRGTQNVYRTVGNGQSQTIGFRISWLF